MSKKKKRPLTSKESFEKAMRGLELLDVDKPTTEDQKAHLQRLAEVISTPSPPVHVVLFKLERPD